jgi:hypothetical protein
MAYAQSAGMVFFPLDEELELQSGKLTPKGRERLVRLSGWMPFRQATELFEEFTGIRLSKIVSQRGTEIAGRVYEEMQDAEAQELLEKKPRPRAKPKKVQISADGCMVPLLHGVWAEVRTLVVGEVQAAVKEKGEMVVHTRNLSYFSRKVSSQKFETLALVEMHRRGVENAREVAAVMDGAEWEQSFSDYHCPRAVRILDFAHAAEHISPLGEFLHGEQTSENKAWLHEHLHQLKHEGPTKLLSEFQKLQRKHPTVELIRGNLAYLKKREAQMQYPTFQTQGWPIGSGIVESGNKVVVEARLKGSGMHWAEQNVNPMLAMRNILCSERWHEDWHKIENALRARTPKKTVPAQPQPLSGDEALLLILKEKLADTQTLSSAKKSKSNPWRNFKHGKALFQRSLPPKL